MSKVYIAFVDVEYSCGDTEINGVSVVVGKSEKNAAELRAEWAETLPKNKPVYGTVYVAGYRAWLLEKGFQEIPNVAMEIW